MLSFNQSVSQSLHMTSLVSDTLLAGLVWKCDVMVDTGNHYDRIFLLKLEFRYDFVNGLCEILLIFSVCGNYSFVVCSFTIYIYNSFPKSSFLTYKIERES